MAHMGNNPEPNSAVAPEATYLTKMFNPTLTAQELSPEYFKAIKELAIKVREACGEPGRMQGKSEELLNFYERARTTRTADELNQLAIQIPGNQTDYNTCFVKSDFSERLYNFKRKAILVPADTTEIELSLHRTLNEKDLKPYQTAFYKTLLDYVADINVTTSVEGENLLKVSLGLVNLAQARKYFLEYETPSEALSFLPDKYSDKFKDKLKEILQGKG